MGESAEGWDSGSQRLSGHSLNLVVPGQYTRVTGAAAAEVDVGSNRYTRVTPTISLASARFDFCCTFPAEYLDTAKGANPGFVEAVEEAKIFGVPLTGYLHIAARIVPLPCPRPAPAISPYGLKFSVALEESDSAVGPYGTALLQIFRVVDEGVELSARGLVDYITLQEPAVRVLIEPKDDISRWFSMLRDARRDAGVARKHLEIEMWMTGPLK